MASIAHGIAGNTICALGDAAAWPMLGFLTKFRPDFEAAIAKSPSTAKTKGEGSMMRLLIIITSVVLAWGAAAALAPSVAAADPIPAQQVDGHQRDQHRQDARRTPIAYESQGKGMALLFWAFAAASVGGALFVITRRNLIAAVMGMVGSFLGIAAIYMMLYAHFLSVMQMLVYAGAIMVLFVFVVMILNRPEDEPVAPSGRAGQGARRRSRSSTWSGGSIMLLWKVQPPSTAMQAPGPTPEGHAWGSVKAVGTDLFNGGLFPFEAVSILLLVAVVGAIAIARPLHEGQDNEGNTPEGEGH